MSKKAEEFFREKMIEYAGSETSRKINKVVNFETEARIMEEYFEYRLNNGDFPLNEYAKEKLEYIKGNAVVRYFPNQEPSLEWAGAVIDLLEELGL